MTRVTKEEDTDEELRRAFQVFDRDNSGTISTEELRDVLKSVGEDLTDLEVDEMMRQADTDGDGTIDCRSHCSKQLYMNVGLTAITRLVGEFVGLMRGTGA